MFVGSWQIPIYLEEVITLVDYEKMGNLYK